MSTIQSDTTTQGIRIQVSTMYLAEKSDPARGVRVFAYRVRISNEGSQPAKLLRRHWIITDAWGTVQEVRGDGVVGQQPHMAPGETFEYTSFCPLPTARGTMHGTYEMVRDDGTAFDVEIGQFHLAEPGMTN